MTVAVLLAIRLVVAVFVGDRVGEREAVMRGDEVDAAGARAVEDVRRSRDPRRERPRIASPRQKRRTSSR